MRLVIISNRLPLTIVPGGVEGKIEVRPSSGGLITAMEPVLSKTSGVWIGWPGCDHISEEVSQAISTFSSAASFEMAPVELDPQEVKEFYGGFSNAIIWPLFHDLQSRCDFKPEYWEAYLKVQDKFCHVAQGQIKEGDFVWVHDYHLFGLGNRLKQTGSLNRFGFFLHIPFPSPDIFTKLPWAREIFEDLLCFDVVGLQTQRDLRNFIDTYNVLYQQSIAIKDSKVLINSNFGKITVGAFPISIDFQDWQQQAANSDVIAHSQEVREKVGSKKLIVSVDRLDYSKGIPERLRSFSRLLAKYPETREQVTLLQVVVPSRGEVEQYQALKTEIEILVAQINGEYSQPGWTPVRHFFRSISREVLLAYFLAADAVFVTPIKDGMNLIAKEFAASRNDFGGRLILSEFAGAAERIGQYSVLVNPYDFDRTAEALYSVLNEDLDAAANQMRELREFLAKEDVFHWAKMFLLGAGISDAAALLGEERETIWSILWKKLMLE